MTTRMSAARWRAARELGPAAALTVAAVALLWHGVVALNWPLIVVAVAAGGYALILLIGVDTVNPPMPFAQPTTVQVDAAVLDRLRAEAGRLGAANTRLRSDNAILLALLNRTDPDPPTTLVPMIQPEYATTKESR